MSISTPPPQTPTPAPAPVAYEAPAKTGASALGGTNSVSYESTEVDSSSQNNINESRNVNVQQNNAYSHVQGEYLGGGIKLNNPITISANITSNGRYTQGSINVNWVPARGKSARKILKQRRQQITQSINHAELDAQLRLEKHCSELLRLNISSSTCTGIVVAVKPAPVQPKVIEREVIKHVERDPHVAPAPVRGLW